MKFTTVMARTATGWLSTRAALKEAVDDEKKAHVVLISPDTSGTVEISELPEDNYILNLGPKMYVSAEQHYSNGTVQLTLKVKL
jgi:hypothetical protein